MNDGLETDHGLPVVLRQRHRWVSPAAEKKIEEALRLHVDAHFLLHFCPCEFHDVFPYLVIVNKMDCFAGEGHVVDKDCFPQYINAIRPVIKMAITLTALNVEF